MKKGVPRDDGARAALVCQFTCDVQAQCAAKWTGVSAIAGAGWFDNAGRLYSNPTGTLDVYQTAAYLGVPEHRVRAWIGKRLFVVARTATRSWFSISNVKQVAKTAGPEHGTYEAADLHILRGEPVCVNCQELLIHQTLAA